MRAAKTAIREKRSKSPCYEHIARDIPSGFNYEDFNRVKEEQRIYVYQKDLKETKWRRDRIGIAKVRESDGARKKRDKKRGSER